MHFSPRKKLFFYIPSLLQFISLLIIALSFLRFLHNLRELGVQNSSLAYYFLHLLLKRSSSNFSTFLQLLQSLWLVFCWLYGWALKLNLHIRGDVKRMNASWSFIFQDFYHPLWSSAQTPSCCCCGCFHFC